MGRLIDEDDVLKVLCRELCHPGAICPDGYCVEMREKLKDVPTSDAVPVIRCKDCAHNNLPPTAGNAECSIYYGMTEVYGFCHRGERREE